MTLKSQRLYMPHNYNQEPCTNLNQVSLTWPKGTVRPPRIRLINVRHFQNTQVVNTTNQCAQKSHRYQSIHVITQTIPEKTQFSKKPLNRWKPLKTKHCNSPSLRLSSRNLAQVSQVPNILWTRNINTSVGLRVRRVTLSSVKRPHNQCPHHHGAQDVQKHVNPEPLSKLISSKSERHQKQPHISYTRKSQQTFQGRLSQRSKPSYNKTSPPKKPQSSRTVTNSPNVLETTSPEKQHLNFRKSADHQSNTTPCPHINVSCPHVQRSLSQLPQQPQSNQPQPKHCQKVRSCTLVCRIKYSKKFLNRTQVSHCCLPINQPNSQQKKPTTKSPQQEVFYSSLNLVRSSIVHPTKHNNRKTLQFQTNIQAHQIHTVAKQVDSQQQQKGQINVLQMYNTCPFKPRVLQKQDNACLSPQKANNINALKVAAKHASRHQATKRGVPQYNKHKKTNSYCPHIQMATNVLRPANTTTCCLFKVPLLCRLNAGHQYFFTNRNIQRSAPIPKKQKQLEQQKGFRSPNQNIQNHTNNKSIQTRSKPASPLLQGASLELLGGASGQNPFEACKTLYNF